MFSQTIIIGNVGGDPKFQYTQSGVAVANFNVAVNKVMGKGEERKETTTWFRVTVWREKAETVSQYVKKGMKIMVVGEVHANAYIDKNGKPQASLEITASNFTFLSSKSEAGEPAADQETDSYKDSGDDGSDLPF